MTSADDTITEDSNKPTNIIIYATPRLTNFFPPSASMNAGTRVRLSPFGTPAIYLAPWKYTPAGPKESKIPEEDVLRCMRAVRIFRLLFLSPY